MGTALAWLLGSSTAIVMWLFLLWAEHTHDDRQVRKGGASGRQATPHAAARAPLP
jgi:hypothetical protein